MTGRGPGFAGFGAAGQALMCCYPVFSTGYTAHRTDIHDFIHRDIHAWTG